MTDNHPIAPPPELLCQWWDDTDQDFEAVAVRAARWGADQQLEQCVAWLDGYEHEGWAAEQMRNDCRPKPPSLKEQGLKALDSFEGFTGSLEEVDTIRRALESLPD